MRSVSAQPSDFDHRAAAAEHLDDARASLVKAGRELAGVQELAHHQTLEAIVRLDDARRVLANDEGLLHALDELQAEIARLP